MLEIIFGILKGLMIGLAIGFIFFTTKEETPMMEKGTIMKDPRGYPRVYGQPVYKTEYACLSCGANRFGFGWCDSCNSWVDTLSRKEIIHT